MCMYRTQSSVCVGPEKKGEEDRREESVEFGVGYEGGVRERKEQSKEDKIRSGGLFAW